MFLWPVFIKFRCQLYSDLVLQDLCRQRMAGSSAVAGEKRASSLADDDQISPLKSDLPSAGCAPGLSGGSGGQADRVRSPRSSTSSWLVDMCQCVGVPAPPLPQWWPSWILTTPVDFFIGPYYEWNFLYLVKLDNISACLFYTYMYSFFYRCVNNSV